MSNDPTAPRPPEAEPPNSTDRVKEAPATSLSPQEQERIAHKRAEWLGKRLGRFGARALAWLSLVPAWTRQLALDCNCPDERPESDRELALDKLLAEAEVAGLVVQAKAIDLAGRTTRRFWMPAEVCADTRAHLKRSNQQTFLQSEAVRAAGELLIAQSKGHGLSPVVQRWAQLTAQTRQGQGLADCARWLNEKVRQSIAEDDAEEAHD